MNPRLQLASGVHGRSLAANDAKRRAAPAGASSDRPISASSAAIDVGADRLCVQGHAVGLKETNEGPLEVAGWPVGSQLEPILRRSCLLSEGTETHRAAMQLMSSLAHKSRSPFAEMAAAIGITDESAQAVADDNASCNAEWTSVTICIVANYCEFAHEIKALEQVLGLRESSPVSDQSSRRVCKSDRWIVFVALSAAADITQTAVVAGGAGGAACSASAWRITLLLRRLGCVRRRTRRVHAPAPSAA